MDAITAVARPAGCKFYLFFFLYASSYGYTGVYIACPAQKKTNEVMYALAGTVAGANVRADAI